MSRRQQSYGFKEIRLVNPWPKYPWRQSYVVWLISGATLLCFLAVIISPPLYGILAMSCDSDFQIWQLLSASFTVRNLFTLLWILMLQLMLGIPLEHEWSHRDLACVYLLSGIGSSFLLFILASRGLCFASPIGAIAGLLAAVWSHSPNKEVRLFMIIKIRLRILIMGIMIVFIIMRLLSVSPVLALVPISGFVLGIMYCRLEKALQKQEGARHKENNKRISNIEID